MDTLIIHSASDKTKAIVQLLKAFDISFELFKNKDSIEKLYDSTYIKKIRSREEEPSIRIDTKNIWGSILSK